jgi:hypothetical protein
VHEHVTLSTRHNLQPQIVTVIEILPDLCDMGNWVDPVLQFPVLSLLVLQHPHINIPKCAVVVPPDAIRRPPSATGGRRCAVFRVTGPVGRQFCIDGPMLINSETANGVVEARLWVDPVTI